MRASATAVGETVPLDFEFFFLLKKKSAVEVGKFCNVI